MFLGVEDVYAIELEEITELSTSVSVDKALLKALEAMYTVNYSARTINRLYLLLISKKFTSLSIIYRVVKSVYYASVLTPDMSFAVRCKRISKHDFTSINIIRVVG
jgi:23S rRNA G2445 N2-methylase RlmL